VSPVLRTNDLDSSMLFHACQEHVASCSPPLQLRLQQRRLPCFLSPQPHRNLTWQHIPRQPIQPWMSPTLTHLRFMVRHTDRSRRMTE
jgi:hypothetical protein